MNAFGRRSYAEDKSRSAVDVPKGEAKFSAGIFRIDRLVRIKARLSAAKSPKASQAISGDLAFQSDRLSLAKLSSERAINCRKVTCSSKLIARKRPRDRAAPEPILGNKSVAILIPQLRIRPY